MATSIGFDVYAKDRASSTFKSVGSEAEKGTSKLHSFGKVAAGVFAGNALLEGAQKAAEFLKGSVEAAEQDQQANAILARQLKNTTGATSKQIKATEDWVTKTAEASGVAKTDITPSLTKLATVTGSVTKAQKLTTLAMNVSAGTHKNLTSITDALVRAQNGSVGGLSRLGIATKNADGSTKSFKQVQAELSKQFKGDTAAAADTAAGKMKRLGVTWEEMKVQIGDKLLPMLANLAGFFLDKVLPAVSQVSAWLETKLRPAFIATGQDAAEVVDLIKSHWGQISAWVKTNFGQVATDVKDAIALVKVYTQTELKVIEFVWKHWGNDILAVLKVLFNTIMGVLRGAFRVIGGIIKVALALFHGDWKQAWQGIKEIVSGVLLILKSLLKGAFDVFKVLMHAGWTAMKLLTAAAWTGIKALVRDGANGLVDLIRGIPSDIKALAHLYVDAGKALITALFHGLEHAAAGAGSFAVNIATSIGDELIKGLNAILPHHLSINKGPIHINVPLFPSIPMLADGGIVRARPGGTLAVLGEGGRDEAVLPLGRGGFSGGGVGGGVTINVYASGLVDPQTMTRAIWAEVLKLQRRGAIPAL